MAGTLHLYWCEYICVFFFVFVYNGIDQDRRPQTALGFEVFPNPADEVVSVRFDASEIAKGIIQISDVTGRVIRHIEIDILTGENLIELNTSELSPGLYHFHIESNTDRFDSKVIIQ